MADHPVALRPSGASPSPNPQQQQQYQQRISSASSTNFSTRFPSAQAQYAAHQPQAGEASTSASASGSSYSPITPGGNPFVDGHPAPPQSRSGSSTHNYPIAISSDTAGGYQPVSPPQQYAQPLLAQHSGYASGALGHSSVASSRPMSRSSAVQSPAASGPMYHHHHHHQAGVQGQSQGQGQGPVQGGPPSTAPSTRPGTSSRSPFSTPVTSPPRARPIQILLINPNSTRSMTDACIASVRPTLPPSVELTGYTAPYPAPMAIESATDAVMSTEAVLRDLAKYAASNGETVQNYDGMIIACFSQHPLIAALRESYDVPIIGIMEASLYVARMLGGRFGIIATSTRSRIMHEDAVAAYGLSHFFVGCEATHLAVLELDSKPREEVNKRIVHTSRSLAIKGADTLILGCAGMTDLLRAAKDAVRDEDGRRTINVVDGVEAGVQIICALVGMGVPTSKKGVYKGERDGRRARGQNWL